MRKLIVGAAAAAALAAGVVTASPASAQSMLVPSQVSPGTYWATPTTSLSGYVEVCSDYSCQVGSGMIQNFLFSGRTIVTIPATARMINIERATLTPAGV
jgi:hypothetical protein